MKTVYKSLLVLSLFSSIGGYSQNSNFSFLNEDKPSVNKEGLKVFGEAMAGSNSLNTQMFTEVLIKPTFTEKVSLLFWMEPKREPTYMLLARAVLNITKILVDTILFAIIVFRPLVLIRNFPNCCFLVTVSLGDKK